MRQIILDTETTGLEPEQGHRIIEIGCLEMENRRITQRRFHQYLNPERDIDDGAIEVHGLTLEDLKEKPRFEDIAEEFLSFIDGAELIIHNAAFDVGFIDHELARLGPSWGTVMDRCTVFDTLNHARTLHPGQRNSLDALCRRYDVDNAHRDLHGALLDAEILAEVYLAMTGGQVSMLWEEGKEESTAECAASAALHRSLDLIVIAPNKEELAAHDRRLAAIDEASEKGCVWLA